MTGSIFSSIRVSKMSAIFIARLLASRWPSQDVAPVHEFFDLPNETIDARLNELARHKEDDRPLKRGVIAVPKRLHDGARTGRGVKSREAFEHYHGPSRPWSCGCLTNARHHGIGPH